MKNLSQQLRGEFKENFAMANFTSWHIGGPAQYFYRPADLQDLALFLQTWNDEPLTLLGAATNVLILDSGIPGVVIYLRETFNKIEQLNDFSLRAEAGASCARLVHYCASQGYIDAAFLAGIPGTVGGLLAMNAGASGDCIWNHVTRVETITRAGEIKIREPSEFKVEYRKISGLSQQAGYADEWFIAANLVFAQENPETALRQVREQIQKRKASQPSEPSCGSVFKNPPGDFAARLIEACGLKGKICGGAQISTKHANFIVNNGAATARDVTTLIQEISFEVEKQHQVKLELEVKILPK